MNDGRIDLGRARPYAAATLPNRRPLLRELGFTERDLDRLADRLSRSILGPQGERFHIRARYRPDQPRPSDHAA